MNVFTVIGIIVVSTIVGTLVGVIIGSYSRKELERRDNEERGEKE